MTTHMLNVSKAVSRGMHNGLKLWLALGAMLLMVTPSFGITWYQRVQRDADTIRRSLLPKDNPNYLTPWQEAAQFAATEAEYRLENPFSFFGVMGMVSIDGQNPSAFVNVGSTVDLSFTWINQDLGVSWSGPPIGSVLYEESQTPDNLSSFVPLGFSYDATHDFSFNFTANQVEEGVLAIPFDPNDNPIILPGLNGYNIAEGFGGMLATPEPGTLGLLGSGILGLCGVLRRRLLART